MKHWGLLPSPKAAAKDCSRIHPLAFRLCHTPQQPARTLDFIIQRQEAHGWLLWQPPGCHAMTVYSAGRAGLRDRNGESGG